MQQKTLTHTLTSKKCLLDILPVNTSELIGDHNNNNTNKFILHNKKILIFIALYSAFKIKEQFQL